MAQQIALNKETSAAQKQEQFTPPIYVENHIESRDRDIEEPQNTLDERDRAHRTSSDDTLCIGDHVVTNDGRKGVIRLIRMVQIELDDNEESKNNNDHNGYYYCHPSECNKIGRGIPILDDIEEPAIKCEEKYIHTPTDLELNDLSEAEDNLNELEVPSDWEGDENDDIDNMQNDYDDDHKDEERRNDYDDQHIHQYIEDGERRNDIFTYQMMYIPGELTRRAIDGGYIKAAFPTNKEFYHYLNNTHTLQKLNKSNKTYKCSKNCHKMAIFNTGLRRKPDDNMMFSVGFPNDDQQSQIPWKMHKLMTATQITKRYGISMDNLPKGCRDHSKAFINYVPLSKRNITNGDRIYIKHSSQLQIIWTQQQNPRKTKGKKKGKRTSVKKENVLIVKMSELNEYIERALHSDDPEDDLKIIVSFEKRGRGKQINGYCIDHLLPVKIRNSRIGIIWRDNKPNIICSDWNDIQNKIWLYNPSNGKLPDQWLLDNITDLKLVDDIGGYYKNNNFDGRPKKTSYYKPRQRQTVPRYLQSAPQINTYNDNDQNQQKICAQINNAAQLQQQQQQQQQQQICIPSISQSVSNIALCQQQQRQLSPLMCSVPNAINMIMSSVPNLAISVQSPITPITSIAPITPITPITRIQSSPIMPMLNVTSLSVPGVPCGLYYYKSDAGYNGYIALLPVLPNRAPIWVSKQTLNRLISIYQSRQ